MSDDQDRLEEITEVFTKALIRNKFEDLNYYKDLAKRLAVLIDAEIVWKENWDKNLGLMSFWPRETLN